MKGYKLAESEEKFAELIWQNEPIGSGELVWRIFAEVSDGIYKW